MTTRSRGSGNSNGSGIRGGSGRGVDRADAAIRKVTFASCYVYSPAGVNAASARSRQLRAMLKSGDAHFILKYAVRVRQQVAGTSPLAGFLCARNWLVPIPGSARSDGSSVSIAEYLARALLEEGLGYGIWRGLHRIRAVQKSATAPPGSRPTVANHYDSFAIRGIGSPGGTAGALEAELLGVQAAPEASAVPAVQGAPAMPRVLGIPKLHEAPGMPWRRSLPEQLVLIDDVVTKGRTLLAAAARVHEALPDADIRAFALLRTMGWVQGVDRLLDPCVGEIRWRAGDAYRNP
ncbi:MAG: hypothetical protein M3N97_12770 [Pseudomonadota bacterium]|nr:hypothetical protein [Pseudomonadota bacterium]